MLNIMLIQRNGVTTHRILIDEGIRFEDFHNLVTHENFGHPNHADSSKNLVYVPHSDTMYTLLPVSGAVAL